MRPAVAKSMVLTHSSIFISNKPTPINNHTTSYVKGVGLATVLLDSYPRLLRFTRGEIPQKKRDVYFLYISL